MAQFKRCDICFVFRGESGKWTTVAQKEKWQKYGDLSICSKCVSILREMVFWEIDLDQLLDSGDEKKTTKADDALEALKKKALDALEAEKTGIDRELDLWLRENLDISLEDLNAAGIRVCWSCYKNNAVRFVKRGYRADPVQSPDDLGGWFEQIQKEENERDMKGKGLRNRYEAEKSSRIGNWLRAFFKRG